MSPFHVLLVGGPAHGTALWVREPKTVRWMADDGKTEIEYKISDFVWRDQTYCIGLFNATDEQMTTMVDLIRKVDLQPCSV